MSLTTSGPGVIDTRYAASRDTPFSAGKSSAQFVALRDAKGTITTLRGTLLGGRESAGATVCEGEHLPPGRYGGSE